MSASFGFIASFDAVDCSSTGIAMCGIEVSVDEPRMSPIGTSPTSRNRFMISGFGG